MKIKKVSGFILALLLLNAYAYAGWPKGKSIVWSKIKVRLRKVLPIKRPDDPSLYRTVIAKSQKPMLPSSATVPSVQASRVSTVQELEVVVVNPNDLLTQSPGSPEATRSAFQLTNLSFPAIAEHLDKLMQRHPEILNNPEYSQRENIRIGGVPRSSYTADQIAMVAAIENQPQWTMYAAERAGQIGDSVYYALKNGHEALANWILTNYEYTSIQDALYEALVVGDMKMADQIYHTYKVDVNENKGVLDDRLLVRMSEKSADGVKWLLAHGAILNTHDPLCNELNAAISGDRVDVLEILYEQGVDFSDALRRSWVMFHPQIVEKLLDLGAVVDREVFNISYKVSQKEDLTPAMREASKKSFDMIANIYGEKLLSQ